MSLINEISIIITLSSSVISRSFWHPVAGKDMLIFMVVSTSFHSESTVLLPTKIAYFHWSQNLMHNERQQTLSRKTLSQFTLSQAGNTISIDQNNLNSCVS